MSKSKRTLSPKLKVKKPVSALFKPVKADYKDLFKALAKGVGPTVTVAILVFKKIGPKHVVPALE